MKLGVAERIIFGLVLGWSASSFGTDIYRAERADGTIFYASQPYDSSYTLYLKGPEERASSLKSNTSRESRVVATAKTHEDLVPLIAELAKKHAIDVTLIHALISVESSFNHDAISAKGAAGLMQLMPATAARYGITNRHDPSQNIDAGIRYLKDLLDLHNGNVALALASYNAGERSVSRYGRRIPPYKETMLYVPAVLSRMQTGIASPPP